jgi:uncharacterized repeat protein (TIGR01451 family)
MKLVAEGTRCCQHGRFVLAAILAMALSVAAQQRSDQPLSEARSSTASGRTLAATAATQADAPQARSGVLQVHSGTVRMQPLVGSPNGGVQSQAAAEQAKRDQQAGYQRAVPPANPNVKTAPPSVPESIPGSAGGSLPLSRRTQSLGAAPTDFAVQVSHDLPPVQASYPGPFATFNASVATLRNTVVVVGGAYATVSTDGGQSFNSIASGGGGTVQAAPAQNMFLWGEQESTSSVGTKIRLFSAVGASAVANNTWNFIDFSPQDLGLSASAFQYFNLTVSTNYAYVTAGIYTVSQYNTGPLSGYLLLRFPLAQLASGGSASYEYVILNVNDPALPGKPQCTEGATTTMYCGALLGNNGNAIRTFSWPDGAIAATWHDTAINPFNFLNGDAVAPNPIGLSFLSGLSSSISGSWLAKGLLGYMWTAKQDATFPYPYTIVAQIDPTNFTLASQTPIWSGAGAWISGTGEPNAAGNVGGLLLFTGPSDFKETVAWFYDDVSPTFAPLANFVVAQSASDDGDFTVSVRQHDLYPNSWVAGLSYTGLPQNLFPTYRWFGRVRDLPSSPPAAALSVSSTHVGDFAQSQIGATYSVTVSNGAVAGYTSGMVTVTDNVPGGLTLVSIAGPGWTCAANSCTRSDVVGPQASYPPITVTVNVGSNAPSTVSNSVSVSGGGSVIATASDVTIIANAASLTVISANSPNPSTFGRPVSLKATVSPAAATGKVTFYDGTTVLGTGTVSNGQASLTTSALAQGSRRITAVYAGDATYETSLSKPVVQTVTALPQGGFRPPVSYSAGPRTNSVAVGDFNGDGKSDLALANTGGDDVSVMLGNGDGTFQTALHSKVAGPNDDPTGGPTYVAVGDFNGDGKLDLVTANSNNATISVLLGNGDGTFQKSVAYTVGSTPVRIAIGDFNGDGKPDLVVTNSGSSTVSVLLGNGDGTFQTAVSYAAGGSPYSVAVGDFNGDGKPDLGVSNNTNSGSVSVLIGNGDGTFQPPVAYAVGYLSSSIAVADFNGDGKLDLVANGGTAVSVLLGNGDGTFQNAIPSAIASGVFVVGDFNGDGKPDLAALTFGSSGIFVSVFVGNGDGTFQAAMNYSAGSNPTAMAVGEFNGDGLADLAVPNNGTSISVLLGAAGGAPNLSLGITDSGNFYQGQSGATYTVTVSNVAGAGATNGQVSVSDAPSGLTIVSMTGAGWTCSGNTCTRADALTGGASYPAITVTANVAANAAATITNTVSVSGGGSTPATASDVSTVTASSIGTLTPSALGAGSVAFTLTVDGSGFLAGAVVTWNGSPRPTTFVANYRVTAAITAADVASVGTVSVAVVNPGGGAAASTFTVLNPYPGVVQTWFPLYPTGTVPAPRYGHSAVLDVATNQMIIFGGYSGNSGSVYFNELWRMSNANGTATPAWTQVAFSGGPGGLIGHAAVYSAATNKMIVVNSTQVWVLANANGVGGAPAWSLLAPGGSTPPARVNPVAGYDAASNRMVVFAGTSNSNFNDVWVLSNASNNANDASGPPAWVQLITAGTAPPAAQIVGGVYDPTSNRLIALAGTIGRSGNQFLTMSAVYVLTNANGLGGTPTWTQLALPPAGVAPQTRNSSSLTYSATTNEITMFGGDGGYGTLNDLWVLSNANGLGGALAWKQLIANGGPPATRSNHTAVYDPSTDRMTIFGGTPSAGSGFADNDVWMLTGADGLAGPTALTIAGTHNGHFVQGQTGATYTVTVSAAANARPTNGSVTVTDTIPTGLTLVSMTGLGWTCSGNTCSRNDPLYGGNSYPAITVTVNVAANSPSTVTNSVAASGGGSPSASSNDPTSVTAVVPPALTLAVTHTSSFIAGQNGATYSLAVSNGTSAGPSSGTVTVTEIVPTGLSLVSMTGLGWTCSGNSCTRNDTLNGGASYPAITVTVNVAANPPATVTNSATVSGGGSATATASDVTALVPGDGVSPIITNLFPASVARGSGALSLTINGLHFQPGAVVSWNGSPRTVTSASSTQMFVTITGVDTATAGVVRISVANYGGNTATATFAVVEPNISAGWIQQNPLNALPPQIQAHSAVFDSVTNQMIVFGGQDSAANATNKIWRLTNASGIGGTPAWTQITAAGGPSPRWNHSAVYSSSTNRMIVFGGFVQGSGTTNEVWVLTNANGVGGSPAWLQLHPTGSIPTTAGHFATYDETSDSMIAFGEPVRFQYTGVWVLTNASGANGTPAWVQLSPGGQTPNLTSTDLAQGFYDSTNNRLVVYTYSGNVSYTGDVYVLTNANGLGGTPTWTKLAPSGPLPPARYSNTVIYSPATNQMTIFGGLAGTSGPYLNDVWSLSHANGLGGTPVWTQLASIGGPPLARSNHTAVYDAVNNRMTVFGGIQTVPGGLAYDPESHIYNQATSSQLFNDVWILADANGMTYTLGDVFPSTSDSAGNFGDGGINTLDLLAVLRATVNIPGATPAKCSDRFDAMDAFPPDTATQRGGDGVLNTLDLVALLKRAVNLDTSRPVRTPRGGVCPASAVEAAAIPRHAPEGRLQLTPASPASDDWQRTAVYLRADVNLDLTGLTIGVGVESGPVRFVAADQSPTLVDTSVTGSVAAAWLDGWTVQSGQRVLLGYVESPGDSNVKFHGVSANTADGRTVNLSLTMPNPATGGRAPR